jgi:hypothetical protein
MLFLIVSPLRTGLPVDCDRDLFFFFLFLLISNSCYSLDIKTKVNYVWPELMLSIKSLKFLGTLVKSISRL